MKKTLILSVFGFLFLCACTPSQRIARIAEKYNLKKYENVIFRDTIYVPSDTIIFETKMESTGAFYQFRDHNEVSGYVKDSIVHLKFITRADTIYIEKNIPVETIKVETVEKQKGRGFLLFLIGLSFGIAFLFYMKHEKK
jgi:hypothetical protein